MKLPRVPVADNIPGANVPVFRNLWEHIRPDMPRAGRGNAVNLEDRSEANKNNEEARVWISGLEIVKRKLGVRQVVDLSPACWNRGDAARRPCCR